ncbi:MAG: cbb3-type cytochrome oxidase assembly protein CcoS [Gammaproteobacteria bacterium]|nr:cbb3-type cytochrome oxidase assembly protein CcoS [Gammaproteobacteria bacterium]
MQIIYLLIPLSLVLVGVALWGFFWAVKNGQFDDLDSPAIDILNDDAAQAEDTEQAKQTQAAGEIPVKPDSSSEV